MIGPGFGDEIAKSVGTAILLALVLVFVLGMGAMKACDSCHYRIAVVDTQDGGR